MASNGSLASVFPILARSPSRNCHFQIPDSVLVMLYFTPLWIMDSPNNQTGQHGGNSAVPCRMHILPEGGSVGIVAASALAPAPDQIIPSGRPRSRRQIPFAGTLFMAGRTTEIARATAIREKQVLLAGMFGTGRAAARCWLALLGHDHLP